MTVKQLELTIRFNGDEWTITTEECIRERLWLALASHYINGSGPNKEFGRLFRRLYQLQESIDYASRLEDSMVNFYHLSYLTDALEIDDEEVKKP